MTFERLIEIAPAWDRRDPDPKKNGGVGSVEARFVLKGAAGATQFVLMTGWYLPECGDFTSPLPVDRGYHSLRPFYEGQPVRNDCPYLDGKPCYYDGSGLNADVVWQALLREGLEGVWRELEYYYHEVFERPLAERTGRRRGIRPRSQSPYGRFAGTGR